VQAHSALELLISRHYWRAENRFQPPKQLSHCRDIRPCTTVWQAMGVTTST